MMCCCVFWPGEMTFCSFNTLADGTLRLLTLVQHPPFPTHHQLKNATPTLKPAIVIQPVWNKRDLWPGWGQGGAEVPPPPSPDPPVWTRDRLLTNILSIFGSCDDPRRSPASLPGAGSRQRRGKFPPRTTSSLLPGWGPAPFPALTVSGQRLSVNSCLHHTTASSKLRWHTLTCRSCAPFWTNSWEIEDFFSDSCSLLTFFCFRGPSLST